MASVIVLYALYIRKTYTNSYWHFKITQTAFMSATVSVKTHGIVPLIVVEFCYWYAMKKKILHRPRSAARELIPCRPVQQSCIKYSTSKYKYQCQWSKYQYKYQYMRLNTSTSTSTWHASTSTSTS